MSPRTKQCELCGDRGSSSNFGSIPPSGWLHATFTTRPGALVGINFESLEGLEIMALHMTYYS